MTPTSLHEKRRPNRPKAEIELEKQQKLQRQLSKWTEHWMHIFFCCQLYLFGHLQIANYLVCSTGTLVSLTTTSHHLIQFFMYQECYWAALLLKTSPMAFVVAPWTGTYLLVGKDDIVFKTAPDHDTTIPPGDWTYLVMFRMNGLEGKVLGGGEIWQKDLLLPELKFSPILTFSPILKRTGHINMTHYIHWG